MVLQLQLILQEIRQLVRGYGVGDDGAARIIRGKNSCHHGNQSIAANLLAVRQHRAHAVHIRIKDNAQVCPARQHCSLDSIHGHLILRVRDVVREAAVRLQVKAAGSISPQLRQHLAGKEAPGAIASIHHNVHAGKRLFIVIAAINALTDFLAKAGRININQCQRLCQPQVGTPFLKPCRRLQQLDDVLLFKAAICGEELQAVAVKRQMAGSNHDGAVHLRFREDNGHEHGRSGSHAAVKSLCPLRQDALQSRFLQAGGRQAGVMPHRDFQLTGCLPQLLGQKFHKGGGNQVGRLRAQVHRLALYPLQGNATHIAAILQLHQFFFCHMKSKLLSHTRLTKQFYNELYMVMVFSSTNTLHLCFQPMGKSQTYSCYNDFPSSHNAHKVL